jgi:hypothetical protein
MNTNKPEFDDGQTEYQEEWLSAYLDGELTDEQRQIVEARLAVDANAQTTLADLERVRTLVKQLPAWNGRPVVLSSEILSATADDENVEFEVNTTRAMIANAERANADKEGDDIDMALAETTSPDLDISERWLECNRSPSNWRWLRPLAAAASLLLMVGIGYLLWPDSGSMDLASSSRGEVAKTAEEANADLDREAYAVPNPVREDQFPQEKEAGDNSTRAAASQGLGDDVLLNKAMPAMDGQLREPTEPAPRRLGLGESADKGDYGAPDGVITHAELNSPAEASEAANPFGRNATSSRGFSGASTESAANSVDSSVAAVAEMEVAAEAADRTDARPPAHTTAVELKLARSDSWSDAAVVNELASNPALSGLRKFTSEKSMGNSVTDSPASILLARIPQSQDTDDYFDRILSENRFTVLADQLASAIPKQKSIVAERSLSGLSGEQTEGATALHLAELPAPSENSSASGQRHNSQSIVLFLSYEEAERLLQTVQESAPSGGKASYSWIKPAAESSARSEAPTNQRHPERVILFLNSASE